ncbi:hypothetical protein [Nostoc sp.]|uniref:hypothetical protein n=1 Tax=Nostoc sp. TaxID=1180 RepID=UPI002FF89948
MTYQETAYQKVNVVDGNGNVITSFGGGSGGGGDASATNQATQITRETEIRDRLPSALVNGRLPTDSSGVTQPISALNLPLPSGAATDVVLQQVRDAIKAQIDIASTIWTDNTGAFYVRRDLINEGTGAITVAFADPSGSAATPGAGLRPLSVVDKDTLTDFYDVLVSGTGYSVGDLLSRVGVLDINNTATPTFTAIWLNLTTGTILSSAPTPANIERANENIGARQAGIWSVVASGNVAAGATDSGNPLKIGGVYKATPPTLADGQRGDLQLSSRSNLLIDTINYVSSPIDVSVVDSLSTSSTGQDNQVIIRGNPTANSFASFYVSGNSSFALLIENQPVGTPFVGSLQIERSPNGLVWSSVGAFVAGSGFNRSVITAEAILHGNDSSAQYIRVRALAWTSGTARITLVAGQGTGTITVGNGLRLYDQGSNVFATIKAAATAAALTDTALVVAVREGLMPTSGTTLTQILGTASSGFLKASAGNLYAFKVINSGTAKKYLQLFDRATAPTAGLAPYDIFPIPAGDTSQDGLLLIGQADIGGDGISFATGVAWGISTTQTTFTAATASESTLSFRHK